MKLNKERQGMVMNALAKIGIALADSRGPILQAGSGDRRTERRARR